MDNEPIERDLNRRFLLRGGAILAGAAGATAIGAALVPSAAQAATGQFAVVGQPNSADQTTSFTIGSSDSATMTLTNASGPALSLVPAGPDYDGGLAVGEIASTNDGPEVGVSGGGLGDQTTWLATGLDLDQIPVVLSFTPERLLDTRTPAGRDGIRSTSASAFDSSSRLKAGAWMDVAIAPAGIVGLDSTFLNVTAVKPVKGGNLTVSPPSTTDQPPTSTLNYQAGQTIANGAFILTGIADEDHDWYVVRIFTTSVTHVVLDLTGVTLLGVAGSVQGSRRGTLSQRNAIKANRMKRVFR